MPDKNTPLREGIDYTFNEQGLMVLSRDYLLKRGYCCQSGCQNCPWDYALLADPNVPSELADENDGFIYEDDDAGQDDN